MEFKEAAIQLMFKKYASLSHVNYNNKLSVYVIKLRYHFFLFINVVKQQL